MKVSFLKIAEKFLFLVLDSPPHGEQFTAGSLDAFPEGCPCKIDIRNVLKNLEKKEIKMTLY